MNDSTRPIEPADTLGDYWTRPADEVLQALDSSAQGLAASEAARRLAAHGKNEIEGRRRRNVARLFLDRFRSPLLLILVFAAIVALVVQDWIDASIVLGIVVVSSVLSAFQEHRASDAIEKLRARVSAKATVLRDGTALVVRADEVVPGDVVQLSAGSSIPGDGLVLAARDFFASQALLTGETFPVEKEAGTLPGETILAERSNCVFMGTAARSGTATVVIVRTGRATAFGQIAKSLASRPAETEFESGLRKFGQLLMRVMIVVVLAVLAVNVVLGRPLIDTLLFAVALAVGLSPEMLPAILAIALSRGARRMAVLGVIVKRPNAIENLGSMDVLCVDKTGTLTRGVVRLDGAVGVDGQASAVVMRDALINSRLQTGMSNPLDEAVILEAERAGASIESCRKLDEIPYDFARKRVSIVVQDDEGEPVMITKGALRQILDLCVHAQRGDRIEPLDGEVLEEIEARFEAWSNSGFRVLGVAHRNVPTQKRYQAGDESGMTFVGFLLFFDPPEPGVKQTLEELRRLGVQLKIITGDNRLVARHVAEAVGIDVGRVVTGSELATMEDAALRDVVGESALFAEVDPNQKERIIRALQKAGHAVGFLGDGINDAPALYIADVGISVDQAADVAKDAADFVLLEHNLDVLRQGIDEGRRTFANTLKYIFITTSANFGNMISMAVGSLFLPFLPLLAKQILLNNFLSDVPAVGMAGDNVDTEWQCTPHRWDVRLIRRFMISFGLVSTAFDMITFGALWLMVGDTPVLFRTGWFVESLLTELVILFVIRTYKPFFRSRPSPFLVVSAVIVGIIGILIPYVPAAAVFGFAAVPLPVLVAILGIVVAYLWVSELTKHIFYRRSA